ncbi:MAG: IS630 family transposase [Acetobacteraceae bacterium]
MEGPRTQAASGQDFQAVERQALRRESTGYCRPLPRPAGQGIGVLDRRKSQIQALDRTQLGLPIKKGRCGTMTHDYKRHGTTTLFAALDVATGKVIGQCMQRHRHQEWLRFLRRIEAETPKKLDLHLIADNYATHKHASVRVWLKRHPRFHMHFTPTSASWLNQVERFFGLTEDRIRCGVFNSAAQLEALIQQYLKNHNAHPKPFIWTASATTILEKVARGRQALESVH